MADSTLSLLNQLPDLSFGDGNLMYIANGASSYKTTLAKLRTEYLNAHYAAIPGGISENAMINIQSGLFADAGITFDATNKVMGWSTSNLTFKHDVADNTSIVEIKGNGNSYGGELHIYDQDDAEYGRLYCADGVGLLDTVGSSPSYWEARTGGSIGNLRIAEPNNAADAMPRSWLRADINNEITGFANQTDTTLSIVEGTRTFTITPTGANFTVYSGYRSITLTGAQDIVWTDVEGLHYFYIDNADDTLKSTTVFSNALIYGPLILVGYLYWDAANSEALFNDCFDERHGCQMDGATHLKLHDDFGMSWRSGLSLSDITADQSGATDDHAQFGVASGVVADEDLIKSISAVTGTTGLYTMYLDGASGELRSDTDAGFSILTTGTGRLAWNEFTGGAWQLTEVGNNSFVNYHIFASTSNTDVKRTFTIMGQAEYATIIAARNSAIIEINSIVTGQLPLAEYKAIATVIFQTADSYGNAVKARIRSTGTGDDYIDWRGAELGSGSGASPTDHGTMTGRSDAGSHPHNAISTGVIDYALAHDDGAGNLMMSTSIKSSADGHMNVSASYDGLLMGNMTNTSSNAATVVGAVWQVTNDSGYYGLLGMTCSGTTLAGGIYNDSLHLYNEGYALSMYTVDGNQPHVWFTDVADNHNFSFTEKMRLTAAGSLLIGTPSQYASEALGVNGDVYVNGDITMQAVAGITAATSITHTVSTFKTYHTANGFGVGITPTAVLHVSAADSGAWLSRITGQGTSQNIILCESATSSGVMVSFRPNGVTAGFAFLNTGFLGLGTVAPARRLDILDTSPQIRASYSAAIYTDLGTDASGHFTIAPTGGMVNTTAQFNVTKTGVAININSGSVNGAYLRWQTNGVSIGDLGAADQVVSGGAAGDFGITSRNNNLILGANSSEAIRILPNGTALVNASAAVGSEKLRINGSTYADDFYDCATGKGLKVNGTQVVTDQQTALTAQLTTITFTAPTPDYVIQDLTNTGPYGFVTQDEGNTVLSVIANLQTRVDELETKLQAHGLLA